MIKTKFLIRVAGRNTFQRFYCKTSGIGNCIKEDPLVGDLNTKGPKDFGIPLNLMKRLDEHKDKTILIPSMHEARIVGCICKTDDETINWMWISRGPPKECGCGFKFQLVKKDESMVK